MEGEGGRREERVGIKISCRLVTSTKCLNHLCKIRISTGMSKSINKAARTSTLSVDVSKMPQVQVCRRNNFMGEYR